MEDGRVIARLFNADGSLRKELVSKRAWPVICTAVQRGPTRITPRGGPPVWVDCETLRFELEKVLGQEIGVPVAIYRQAQ